ncbi:ABC transporter permease [Turicimonas muris]|uniref:ABC transporter permease n=1 Tax=Turicimonas muris TaxID=1796652 RepID=UPI0025A51F1C|nr:ABC transporter permease [Turicimonas muris]
MFDLVVSTISQGLLWAIMALGVFLTFRVLDIADLSVEGTFPLGAAVAAILIASDQPIWLATLLAVLAGCVAGTVTAILTTKLKIPALLSGILTMIGLYSVNLMVMGKANVPLLRNETIFTLTESTFGVSQSIATFIVGFCACLIVGLIMYWFFGTVLGTAIRATGCNPQMARAQGINTDLMVILGLLISNGLVALAGALVAQSNGFADVGMGTGTIVIGLASVIIGEVLFGTRSFKNWLISVVLGSIVYRIVIALVLEMGMPPNDLKLFTAILVAIALSLPLIRSKFAYMKQRRY